MAHNPKSTKRGGGLALEFIRVGDKQRCGGKKERERRTTQREGKGEGEQGGGWGGDTHTHKHSVGRMCSNEEEINRKEEVAMKRGGCRDQQ